MSERRVTDMMVRQYEGLITDINMFGDMQSSPRMTSEAFEAMRREVLNKIREQRSFLKECENQVKLLQLSKEH